MFRAQPYWQYAEQTNQISWYERFQKVLISAAIVSSRANENKFRQLLQFFKETTLKDEGFNESMAADEQDEINQRQQFAANFLIILRIQGRIEDGMVWI